MSIHSLCCRFCAGDVLKIDHVRPRFGKNLISPPPRSIKRPPSSLNFEISIPGANSRIYGTPVCGIQN